MTSKLRYLWQSLKCAWGWHDIETKENHFYDDFVMSDAIQTVWKCKHCEYKTSFLTYEIKGSFKI